MEEMNEFKRTGKPVKRTGERNGRTEQVREGAGELMSGGEKSHAETHNVEDKIKKRKQKLIELTKDPYTLIFLGILILGIAIRLYFFWIAKSQPLWWDESDYMAYAKDLIGRAYHTITPGHNSLFPYIVAFFFKLGLSEEIIRFILEVLPSMILVFLTYKICILMYDDKRIGLICSFLMAVFWPVLFNTYRFHVDIPAFCIVFLAIYIFWQGYERKEKIFGKLNHNWAVPLTVFLVILVYAVRRGYFLFGFFFLFYMIFTRKIKELLKDKYNWIAVGIGLAALLIAEKFVFTTSIGGLTDIYYHEEFPFTLLPFKVFKVYFAYSSNFLKDSLFYLFILGVFLLVINIVLSLGYIKKSQDKKVKANIFALLTIAITMFHFLFIQRIPGVYGEERYYFSLLLGALICISLAVLYIADYIKKYNKYIAIAVIVLLIGYGGYYEFKYAETTIKGKLISFSGIKEASLFIKGVSNSQDIIFVVPEPQTTYYSERPITGPRRLLGTPSNMDTTLEMFLEKLQTPEAENIRFIIVTFSEPNHPEWMRKDVYTQDGRFAKWQIPFMDTEVDFTTGTQKIEQEKTYGNITFKLLAIKQDAFVYEIIKS